MVTNQTWNVYVVCVWEVEWICTPNKNKEQGWLWSACSAFHHFMYSCITVWQGGRLLSPDQRYGYWTGQDINISPAPFLPSCFSHPLSPFFLHAGIPQSVAHSQCAGGSATSQRHSHILIGDRAKWAEERYLTNNKFAAFIQKKRLGQPALTPCTPLWLKI